MKKIILFLLASLLIGGCATQHQLDKVYVGLASEMQLMKRELVKHKKQIEKLNKITLDLKEETEKDSKKVAFLPLPGEK